MYQPQDFNHLQFNPTDRDVLENNPELEGLFPPMPEPPKKKKKKGDDSPEEDEVADENRIHYEGLKPFLLRYIVALYDPASPLKRDYPKLNNRQMAAAEVADLTENRYVSDSDGLLTILFENSDPFIVGTIHNYLKDYAQVMLYAQIQANESVFWEYVRRMMTYSASADDDIVKSRMGDELGKIQERLEALSKKFYGDDEKLTISAQNVKRKRSNPESWARNV
jgi:hypothetical protein